MPAEAAQRRLAAILAADVVGYSRLMGADEEGTLAALRIFRREVADPAFRRHGGRVFKVMGDGVLVEFGSVLNAVRAAIALQHDTAIHCEGWPEDKAVRLRIGIHLGDVLIDGGDVYGDGVNIAARLEGLAEPGGIVVSQVVRDQVGSKADVGFRDLGEKELKNIREPVRVFAVGQAGDIHAIPAPAPELPAKPSIAVLPFTNLSGDPEQEYFADGMVEDIITALSRFPSLFVIARNSTFVYKGKAVDIRAVGRDLGVRYVLEGSVRRAGNRLRVTGQLIEAATGTHLWADSIDGDMADIFEVQDKVTSTVVGAIAPTLERAEIARARAKPPSSFDAYDHYLRGVAALHLWTREGNEEALAAFTRAIALDPGYAAAYGNAARCFIQRKAGGWVTDPEEDAAQARHFAAEAARLGRHDAIALSTAGMAVAYVLGNLDDGLAMVDRALELNPNLAWGWMFGGWIRVWKGDTDVGTEHILRAIRLSPQDTQIFAMRAGIAAAHLFSGRYAQALDWAAAAIRDQPSFVIAYSIAAAAAALDGRPDEGRAYIDRLAAYVPAGTIRDVVRHLPIARPEHREIVVEGLRRAGLQV